MEYKLGKKSAIFDVRTFNYSAYRLKPLPPAPEEHSWLPPKPNEWGMLGNDGAGDCTCAAAGHQIQTWTEDVTGAMAQVKTEDVIAAYSAISGYDPATGVNDDGANMLVVAKYWRKTGIGGHKLLAFMSVEPHNREHVKEAIFMFGGIYIGAELPITAQKQLDAGQPWTATITTDFDATPGGWGGHAINCVAYDKEFLTAITWGAEQKMSWAWFDNYVSEVYAPLSLDWINERGKSPGGIDISALQRALSQL